MQNPDYQIIIFLCGSILLFIILVTFIIVVIVQHNKVRLQHLVEMKSLEERKNRELLNSRIEIQENIMSTISMELHDNISQILALAKLNLKTPYREDRIDESKALIRTAIDEVRNLSHMLNKDFISSQSFLSSFKKEYAQLKKTGLYDMSIEIEGEERTLSRDIRLMVLRMVQETINNIIKHSKATQVKFTLQYHPDDLTVIIRDNGTGIVGKEPFDSGSGLFNIWNRCQLIKGKAEFTRLDPTGTQVSLSIPFDSSQVSN